MGLLDESLDAGQRSVCAERVDAHADGRFRCHSAGHDAVTGTLPDGAGFAGDHRFVHLGFSVDDDTVGGDPSPGPNQNDVPEPELVERDRLDAGVCDPLSFIG